MTRGVDVICVAVDCALAEDALPIAPLVAMINARIVESLDIESLPDSLLDELVRPAFARSRSRMPRSGRYRVAQILTATKTGPRLAELRGAGISSSPWTIRRPL